MIFKVFHSYSHNKYLRNTVPGYISICDDKLSLGKLKLNRYLYRSLFDRNFINMPYENFLSDAPRVSFGGNHISIVCYYSHIYNGRVKNKQYCILEQLIIPANVKTVVLDDSFNNSFNNWARINMTMPEPAAPVPAPVPFPNVAPLEVADPVDPAGPMRFVVPAQQTLHFRHVEAEYLDLELDHDGVEDFGIQ